MSGHRRFRAISSARIVRWRSFPGLALFKDQPHRARLECFTEASPGSFPFRLGHRGHRIRLSESVHEIGSSPGGGRAPLLRPVFCVLCPVSCVPCPVSRVLCPVSCVLCPVSCVLCPASCVLCSVSCVLCPVSCVLCPASCVLCPVFCVLCSVSCVLCPVFCVLCSASCVLCPVSCCSLPTAP